MTREEATQIYTEAEIAVSALKWTKTTGPGRIRNYLKLQALAHELIAQVDPEDIPMLALGGNSHLGQAARKRLQQINETGGT